MKRKLIDWINSIPEEDAKQKALENLDERYLDEECYCLGYALMLGVYRNTYEDKLFWDDYTAKLNKGPDRSHFYKLVDLTTK